MANVRGGFESRGNRSDNNSNERENTYRVLSQTIVLNPDFPVLKVEDGAYALFEDMSSDGTDSLYKLPFIGFAAFTRTKKIEENKHTREEVTVGFDPLVWCDPCLKGIDSGVRLLIQVDSWYWNPEKRGEGKTQFAFKGLYHADGRPFIGRANLANDKA